MPLVYTPEPLTENEPCIMVFPSISLKACMNDGTEPLIERLYELYPNADYYKSHASSDSKRAKPGDCVVFREQTVIVNMFIHLYPSLKTQPSDNHALRVKWFLEALTKLKETPELPDIHLILLPEPQPDKLDYIQALDDFVCNYKLKHNKELKIVLHQESKPLAEPIKVAKTKISIKSSAAAAPTTTTTANASNLVPPTGVPAFATLASAMPMTPVKTIFRLDFKDTLLCPEVLYEIDFKTVAAALETPAAADDAQTIMSHFPIGWSSISTDAVLLDKAAQVAQKLQAKQQPIGHPNVFPEPSQLFAAFQYSTEPKVVIIGQDPYPTKGNAHGLAFSVAPGVAVPQSLKNIFKAISSDLGIPVPSTGTLTPWAKQGVILLNTALTVYQNTADSHTEEWSEFTNRLVHLLTTQYKGLVFLLWGGKAQAKKKYIAGGRGHEILEFNHPSPSVRNNRFHLDCKHFSETNAILQRQGKTPIDWSLQ